MIRRFDKLDLRRLRPNGYSTLTGLGEMAFIFDDPTFYKQTLEDENGAVICILCFKAYWQNNYLCFLMLSEDADFRHARQIKRFVYNVMEDFQCNRLQTDSLDCDTINRWHRFLGFELEGTRRKIINGQDFNMWAMLAGEYKENSDPVDLKKCAGL